MNKSKFLKKSLAMLLALMLVLAMIPLSASAAAEDHIDVLLVNGKQVARNGDNLSVTVGSTTVSLDAVVKDGVDLYYVDNNGEEKKIDITTGTGMIELADGYTTGVENVYSMDIVAKVKEDAATDDYESEYTYPLTITVEVPTVSTANTLDSLADGNPVWKDMVEYSIDNVTRNVTVTLGFGKDIPDLAVDAFEPAEGGSVTIVDNENIIVSSENDDDAHYTIKYVNEPGFLTFTVPKQVGETEIITKGFDENEININVPYGYDIENVVPTFTTSEKIEKVTVERSSDPVFSGVTELDTTERLILWTDVEAKEYGVFDINLIVPTENPEGVLNTVQVTGMKGSSSVTETTGSTTFVEMPAGTNVDTGVFSVSLRFSEKATVTVTDANGTKEYKDSQTANGELELTGITPKGEGHSFVVVVKSEDGKMTNTYTIQLGKANAPVAEIKSFILKDEATNTTYRAEWDGTTGTVTVPYAFLNSANTSKVKVYIKLNAGSQIYVGNTKFNYNPYGDAYTETLVANNYLPAIGGSVTYTVWNDSEKATYTVKIVTENAKTGREVNSIDFAGEDQTWKITESNTYSAEIGKATLDGNQVNTIKITVPYSWKGEAVYLYNLGISEGAKMYAYNGGWKAVAGVNEAGALSYKTGLTANELDAVDAKGVLDADKAIQVVVLSEKEAVLAGDSFASIKNKYVDGDNATFYYIYAEKAPAETGSELLSIESTLDKNVTATLNGSTITITVPDKYKDGTNFSLNFETSKLANVYATRTETTNGVAYSSELFSDLGEQDNYDDATKFTAYSKVFQKNGGPNISKIYVVAEDGQTSHAYDVKLVVNDAETGADITALSVNGTAATIAGDKITVRLPLGTKLYPVSLDITASKMATVTINGTTDEYDPDERYDLNDEIKITVKSEDNETTKTYTLNAIVSDSFNDVTTDKWYYDEVMTAANAGWINGDEPGYYKPEGTMTRGAFITIIARILGCDTEATVESLYPDCNETDWFNAAVTFCSKRGIIDGDDLGYFNPNAAITREEMAKILCNALELEQVETSADPFEDDAEIAQWAKGYVNACQAKGIFEGADGYFNPRDNATRAEGAAVLVRAFA